MAEFNRFAVRLAEESFDDLVERAAFLECLWGRSDRQRAVVWVAGKSGSVGVPGPDWWPESCELVDGSVRMGDLAEHESGLIYAFDPSSVFEGGILQGILDEDEQSRPHSHLQLVRTGGGFVVDVCAAPGGKTMLAEAILKPGRLVCNEVIGKRLGMLRSNLDRCGVSGEVRNLDPGKLADEFAGLADVVIVDAPCSGQSVLVKGGDNPGCFHPKTVEKNAMRQRRILAESARMVLPGGWLMYSTCTYSVAENEGLVEWFLGRNEEFSAVEVAGYEGMRSRFGVGYREWPHSGLGVGGFTCLLRRDR
ncbi:Fmu (Sun) domain-containing protein [bacterium]|nr:Fmu (Sun) domain-containing protein [bacterium]